MGLTDSDRQWVKAVVEAAIKETALQFYRETDAVVERHIKSCPHVCNYKMLLLGLLIGVALWTTEGVVKLVALLTG